MYLKSLEITGFKSFVDFTHLDFSPGISAIVGPNGCGKSNIVDAIRWVIGEQNTKMLRGSRMEDLIFSGSESRKPLGMAEVSLTVAELPVNISVANLQNLDLDEVKVTRRYFRTGDSEYFINKTPCRMKDIIDLFLDTGISAKGFSVIEQDHVGQIINAKPDKRRSLIEEAAGIMKYKHRRNEALRKLDYTSNNLLRINDVVNELEKQRRSLKRQAKKAEVYKRFKKEARKLGLAIYSMEYKKQKNNFTVLDENLVKIKDKQEEFLAKNAALQNNIETHKAGAEENERQLNQLKQQNYETNGKIENHETRIEIMKKQTDDLEASWKKAGEEIKQMVEDHEKFKQMIESQQKEEEIIEVEISSKESLFNEKNSSLLGLKDSLQQTTNHLEDSETELLNVLNSYSNAKNNEASLTTRCEILGQNRNKLIEEFALVENEFNELDNAVKENKEILAKAKDNALQAKEEKEALIHRLEEEKGCAREAATTLEKSKISYTENTALLNSLNELFKNFEGFHSGVKSIMKFHQEHGGVPGIQDVLINIVDIASEYQIALESVLGDRTQGVITNSPAESIKAVQYLKDEASGRSTFFLLNPKLQPKKELSLNGTKGIVGKLLDLANYPEKYNQVIEYLLGNVLVVENINVALSLWNEIGENYTIVTLGGDVIDPQGTITGGVAVNNGTSLLTKKRKISELKHETQKVKSELDQLQEKQNLIEQTLFSIEQERETVEQKLNEAELNFRVEEKKDQQLNVNFIRCREKLEKYKSEKEQYKTDTQGLSERLEQLQIELKALNDNKLIKEDEIKEVRENINSIRSDMESLNQVVNGIDIERTSLKGKKDNILLDIQRLIASMELTQNRISQQEKEKLENEEKKSELKADIQEGVNQVHNLIEDKKIIEKKLIHCGEELDEKLKILKEFQDRSKIDQLELGKISEETNRLEINRAEIVKDLQYLIEKAKDEFFADEEQMLQIDTSEADPEAEKAKLEDLKTKLGKIGEANLAALDEYEKVNERYTFLMTQQEDLRKSIEDLQKTINKINRTTRKKFLETFELINENFKKIFTRLFKGGYAELILVDKDILETGVDIQVKPPGKKLQNINLLSGGEKAMTAISLLFAVFAVSPSPFCLLDEVDAALDEANILRFKEILKEMKNETQFVLVTHNQRTMSFAETLYGITMEEKGVSKVVSVKLNQ